MTQGKTNEELFGKQFSLHPKQFAFRIGDRLLIKELVTHVKEAMIRNGAGHFQGKEILHPIANETVSNSLIETELNTHTHFLLGKLISAADRNSKRKKGGYRYDSEIKRYASYLRMLAGPLAYETIQRNLEHSLPSLSSTNRYIKSANCHIVEGVLRSEELLIYLKERHLPLKVVLSEDATRIEDRVQYDSSTNQIVGFTLPINYQNGMPFPLAYPARTAEEICRHFSSGNNVSSFLNIIMAQPVKNANPFCLLAFGSDNRYTTSDVSKRWKYIEGELLKVGISVLMWSSDSDPRYNSAMRELSQLNSRTEKYISWFACNESTCSFYSQDTVHIGTKMRNFFLRTIWNEEKLPFGKYYINWNHLKFLLCNFSKGEHQLTATVLNPIDKQNFASVLRMCHPRVTNLLKYHVSDSEATVVFLNIMRDVIDSYLDQHISPLERIRKMWYPLFIIRIWRKFIKTHKQYNLKDNFLTANCYSCLELNAHSLVLCIFYLQKINRPDLFLPYLFESQPCESMFRQLRSFSSTFSTVTNCSIKEALSRISKIQLQNEIIHGTSEHFVYPRLGQKEQISNDSSMDKSIVLPTRSEIIDEIEKCKQDAIIISRKLGLIVNRKQTEFTCKVPLYAPSVHSRTRQKK